MKWFWTASLALVTLFALAAWQLWPAGLKPAEAALADLRIDKMTCGSCVRTIDDALRDLPGVGNVEISVTSGRGRVEYDPRQTSSAAIAACVSEAGYPARVARELSVEDYRALREERDELAATYVARVGDRLVPRAEFEQFLASRSGGGEVPPRQQAAFWNDLLQRELLLNAAEQQGVVVQDGEVEARLNELAAAHADFEARTAARFGSPEALFGQVKDDLIIDRLLEQTASPELAPGERNAALSAWYQELVRRTEVVIFDPVLRSAAAGSGGSGCGGTCCG